MRSLVVMAVAAAACGPSRSGTQAPAAPPMTARDADPDRDDPLALLREGLAARAGGNEVQATRLFEAARTRAEAQAGARAGAAIGETYVAAPTPWSPDGRFALFTRSDYPNDTLRADAMLVVEVATGSAARIPHGGDPRLSPDNSFLVVREASRLYAYQLPSGREVLADRATTAVPVFSADGRLAWADRTGDEDVLYVRDLSSGVEVALRAPQTTEHWVIKRIWFAEDGSVITWSAPSSGTAWLATLRVWRRAGASFTLQVTHDAVLGRMPPLVTPTALVFGAQDSDRSRRRRLHVTTLATGAAVALASKHPVCGNGDLGELDKMKPCAGDTVVVARNRTACQWNVATGALEKTWPTGDADLLSCDGRRFKRPPPTMRGPVMPENDELDFESGPAPSRGTGAPLADSAGAAELSPSPTGSGTSGILTVDAGRAGIPRVWDAAGKVVWTSSAASTAWNVDLSPQGDVVAADEHGLVWHVQQSPLRLHATAPVIDCAAKALTALSDGRAAVLCGVGVNHVDHDELWLEGSKAPLIAVGSTIPPYRLESTALRAGAALATRSNELTVYSLPDGTVRWRQPPWSGASAGFLLAPAADRVLRITGEKIEMLDSSGVRAWSIAVPYQTMGIAVSDDASLFATSLVHGDTVEIRDGATGKVLDQLATRSTAIEFLSPTTVAYWRDGKAIVRDIKARSDLTTPIGKPHAELDAGYVVLWGTDGAPRAKIALAGAGAAVVGATGHVTLLGDAKAARAMLECRVGNRVYPFELCEERP